MRRKASSPKIKKPVIQSRDNRNKNQRSRGKRIQEVKEEEEVLEKPEEIDPSDAWILKTPPFIKPDEELHIKLTKERKEQLARRRLKIAKSELYGIFNFAMNQMRLSDEERRKTEPKRRAEFLVGAFHEPEDGDAPPRRTFKPRPTEAPGIKELLDLGEMPMAESMRNLSRSSSKSEFEYDVNPEMDRLFKIIDTERVPYITPVVVEKRLQFPFIIAVVGPPGTGRTTVCQFIHQYFDVKVIEVAETPSIKSEDWITVDPKEEKLIATRIVDEMLNIDEKKGIVIDGFPDSKFQMGALDREIKAAIKRTGVSLRPYLSGYIRMTMTMEEAVEQTEGRVIDSNTGRVYHNVFNPVIVHEGESINVVQKRSVLCENPKEYTKICDRGATVETMIRKVTQILNIPFCKSIGELELIVENFIKLLYTSKEMNVPFTSFVVFQSRQQFLYAKFCANLYDVWNEKCMPVFGKDLGDLYNRVGQANMQVDYLYQNASKTLKLMIARQDDRAAKANELQEAGNLNKSGEVFAYIWQKSIDIRDKNLYETSKFVNKSPLRSLKGIMEESEQTILELILKRYFIVLWFTRSFTEIIETKNIEDEIDVPDPDVPSFDVTNLRQLCTLMGIDDFIQKTSKSRADFKNLLPMKKGSRGLRRAGTSHRSQVYRTNSQILSALAESDEISLVSTKGPMPFASKIAFCHDDQKSGPVSPRNSLLNDHPSVEAREETVRKFLQFVKEEADSIMVHEANVMMNIYEYFVERRKNTDNKIDEYLTLLTKDSDSIVRRKCTKEMEQFSENFRRFKQGEQLNQLLFTYDISYLDEDTLELYQTLDGKIPQPGEIPSFDHAKLEALFCEMHKRNTRFVTIGQLVHKAIECGFDEKEIAYLRVLIQLEVLPDFIDYVPFFERLAPDMADVFEDIIDPLPPPTPPHVIPEDPPEDRLQPLTKEEPLESEDTPFPSYPATPSQVPPISTPPSKAKPAKGSAQKPERPSSVAKTRSVSSTPKGKRESIVPGKERPKTSLKQ